MHSPPMPLSTVPPMYRMSLHRRCICVAALAPYLGRRHCPPAEPLIGHVPPDREDCCFGNAPSCTQEPDSTWMFSSSKLSLSAAYEVGRALREKGFYLQRLEINLFRTCFSRATSLTTVAGTQEDASTNGPSLGEERRCPRQEVHPREARITLKNLMLSPTSPEAALERSASIILEVAYGRQARLTTRSAPPRM
ncbi:hypothetical protein BKA93DRAFT_813568 [Sparassis latifolia]